MRTLLYFFTHLLWTTSFVHAYFHPQITNKYPKIPTKIRSLPESKVDFFNLMTGVGATGGGQLHNGRAILHQQNAKREFNDPQMWTHIFFGIGGYYAYIHQVFDLLALLCLVTPFSLMYHWTYGFIPSALFIYISIIHH